MESQEGPPRAPPRRRNEERSGSSSLNTLELDGSEHPALRAQEFHRLHRSSVEITAEAQTADEEGRKDDAFKSYSRALHFIDQAVLLAHQGGFAECDVNKVDELTYKLRITRKQILERVSDLQIGTTTEEQDNSYLNGPAVSSLNLGSQSTPAYSSMAASSITPLPSYDDVLRGYGEAGPPSLRSQGQGVNYRELVTALDDIAAEQAAMSNPLPLNAHEVYTVPQNVQIYFISPDDNVSAPSYPSFLRVVVTEQSEEELGAGNTIPAFLQVGDWTYPLVPRSPVLLTPEGLYLFPDPNAKIPGCSVGLILPPDIPAESRQTFEEVLAQLLSIHRIPRAGHPEDIPAAPPAIPIQDTSEATTPTSPTDATRRLSTKIAEGLITGAEAVSKGLVYGATKTSILMDRGASYLQSRMDPVKEKPVIKPEVKKGMKVAKTVTGKAVQVSGFLVNQVGNATMALGRHLAPHVQRAGTRLLAKTTAKDEVDASKKMDQVLEVTSGAVAGFGTLYMGLESAATVLANSLANNTVQIVHHRYGEEAGHLANDTAAAAGGAVMTAWNVQQLGPKSMAKKVAKDTGKQVIKNYKDKKHTPKSPRSPGNGSDSPPGGSGTQGQAV
ncbi:unnamed protein product [Orchesella dallaii]|uniref:Senescence domain-containing protein n=1 Tax=Orchesella dallaii TaxID=48710 RepID=A0ABP1PZA8_9HEXA